MFIKRILFFETQSKCWLFFLHFIIWNLQIILVCELSLNVQTVLGIWIFFQWDIFWHFFKVWTLDLLEFRGQVLHVVSIFFCTSSNLNQRQTTSYSQVSTAQWYCESKSFFISASSCTHKRSQISFILDWSQLILEMIWSIGFTKIFQAANWYGRDFLFYLVNIIKKKSWDFFQVFFIWEKWKNITPYTFLKYSFFPIMLVCISFGRWL